MSVIATGRVKEGIVEISSRRERTDRVLAWIRGYMTLHGYAPSVRDIVDGCELGSTATAHRYLDILAGERWLKHDPKVSRSIVLLDPPKHVIGSWPVTDRALDRTGFYDNVCADPACGAALTTQSPDGNVKVCPICWLELRREVRGETEFIVIYTPDGLEVA